MAFRHIVLTTCLVGGVLGCDHAPAPSPLVPTPPGFAGEWAGTTFQRTPVRFVVSADETVTELTFGYDYAPTCSGTVTLTGLAAPVQTLEPPGTPPFDRPGFRFARNDVESALSIAGSFSEDRRSASGQFSLVNYDGCATGLVAWSATRK